MSLASVPSTHATSTTSGLIHEDTHSHLLNSPNTHIEPLNNHEIPSFPELSERNQEPERESLYCRERPNTLQERNPQVEGSAEKLQSQRGKISDVRQYESPDLHLLPYIFGSTLTSIIFFSEWIFFGCNLHFKKRAYSVL